MALIGIAGTLSLSVQERTRELGVLRALGMTREQTSALVRDESLLTAGVGWLVGIVLGLVLAWAVSHAFAPEGFAFSLAWPDVALVVVAGLLAGLLGSVPPARRVARLDVLVAIAHE
jgi:putative ABC transport system permease protein